MYLYIFTSFALLELENVDLAFGVVFLKDTLEHYFILHFKQLLFLN